MALKGPHVIHTFIQMQRKFSFQSCHKVFPKFRNRGRNTLIREGDLSVLGVRVVCAGRKLSFVGAWEQDSKRGTALI